MTSRRQWKLLCWRGPEVAATHCAVPSLVVSRLSEATAATATYGALVQTVKAAGIWLACGLVSVAIVVLGSLPDRDVIWGALVMPLLMVALFFWFLGGLVMVATWQQHRPERTPG